MIRYVLLISLLLAVVTMSAGIHAQQHEPIPPYKTEAPITTYFTSSTSVPSLDPARAEDNLSINWIENLFLGLSNNNPQNTFEIQPELGTLESIEEEGRVWIFSIRTDVPWVRYDPETGLVEKLRNVVAGDFEWSIKRACDPRLGSRYSSIIAGVIEGCDRVNNADPADLTDELIFGDTVQVRAPDDETLIVTLRYPAPYFYAMSSIWTIRPVHRETVETYGDTWTAPGVIVTNGPYLVAEMIPGVRRVAVINPYMPADLRGPGNVQRLEISHVTDANTNFSLYLADQVDITGVPAAEVENVRSNPEMVEQIQRSPGGSVFYIGFEHARAPFDDVHLRRAFYAIIDREAYIQQVAMTQGEPMVHFTPRGMVGAPDSPTDPGIGFDIDYARKQLALSAYPNCEGLPPISAVAGQGGSDTFEFMKAAAEQYLGCDPDLFTIEELEFSVMLELIDYAQPVQNRPHMWMIGWGADYPDANNWVGDVVSCYKDNSFLRPCSELDDLIEAAARETDPERRNDLYTEIEALLFGRVVDGQVVQEGETPFIPIYLATGFYLVKPWYEGPFETDGLIGGSHWDWRTVDQAAQQTARGGN